MRSIAAVLFLWFASSAAYAQTAERLLADLAGEWEGALGYRDYQSNELFELPVQTSIVLAADGRTAVRTSRFDEGAASAVYIVSASAFGPDGMYETAGFRDGRAMYVTREAVALSGAPSDPAHWTMVFTERGRDDERDADIRVTLTRAGDETLAVKEVDYLDDPAIRWEFRNQTRLRRVR